MSLLSPISAVLADLDDQITKLQMEVQDASARLRYRIQLRDNLDKALASVIARAKEHPT